MASRNPVANNTPITSLGIAQPPEIQVACPAFTGSLALLFHCVQKQKVDVLQVPLAPICRAYLEYLLTREGADLEEAAAALLALSYLIERKAWQLLPSNQPEPEELETPELPEPYAHEFHEAIQALRGGLELREQSFFRSREAAGSYELPFELTDTTATGLATAFERLMRRASPDPVDPPTTARRSLTDMMLVVMHELSGDWKSLDVLVVGEFTRTEAVWWFLALLELIRLGQASVKLAGDDVLFARGKAS